MTEEEKVRKINPYGQVAILNATIIDLEKENAELKAQIEQLSNDNHVLKTSFITQQEQLEKMKCCENCSNFRRGNCKFSLRTKDDVTTFIKTHEDYFCIDYDKWEIAK